MTHITIAINNGENVTLYSAPSPHKAAILLGPKFAPCIEDVAGLTLGFERRGA